GLPSGLYEKILTIDDPYTYEGWRRWALKRQEEYMHLKARREALDRNYGKKNDFKPQFPTRGQKDPNAMDTMPGRVRARLSLTDDPPETPPYPPRARPGTCQCNMSKIKCQNCNQYVHISHMCKKLKKQHEEARVTLEDENPQQDADTKVEEILRCLADEPEEIKNKLIQKLYEGGEDFQSA